MEARSRRWRQRLEAPRRSPAARSPEVARPRRTARPKDPPLRPRTQVRMATREGRPASGESPLSQPFAESEGKSAEMAREFTDDTTINRCGSPPRWTAGQSRKRPELKGPYAWWKHASLSGVPPPHSAELARGFRSAQGREACCRLPPYSVVNVQIGHDTRWPVFGTTRPEPRPT